MEPSRQAPETLLSTFGLPSGPVTPTPRGVVELAAAYGIALLVWVGAVAALTGWLWSLAWPTPWAEWPWLPTVMAAGVAATWVLAATAWRARALLQGDGSGLATWAGGDLISRFPGAIGGLGAGAELDELENRLLTLAAEVARSAGLPRGKIFVLRREPAINAWAAGWTPSTTAIAVTRGALEVLGPEELRALLAQLYAHVKRGDARLQMAAASLVWGFLGTRTAGEHRRGPHPDGTPASSVDRLLGSALVAVGTPMAWIGGWLQQRAASDRELQADAAAARDAPSLRVPLAAVLQKAWYQHTRGTDRLQAARLDALAQVLLAPPAAVLRRPTAWADRLRRLTGQPLEPLPCDLLTPLAVDPPLAMASSPEPAVHRAAVAGGPSSRWPEPAGSVGEPAADHDGPTGVRGFPAPVPSPAATVGAEAPATAAGDLAARMSALAASLTPADDADAGLDAGHLSRVLGVGGPAPDARHDRARADDHAPVGAPRPAIASAAAVTRDAVVMPSAPAAVQPGGTTAMPPARIQPTAVPTAPSIPDPMVASHATIAPPSSGTAPRPQPVGVDEVPASPIAAAWAAARAQRAREVAAAGAAGDHAFSRTGSGSALGPIAAAWSRGPELPAEPPGRQARFGALPPVPPPGSPEAREIERLAGLALSGAPPEAEPTSGFDDGPGGDTGAAPLDDGAPSSATGGARRRHRWRRSRPYADSLISAPAARPRPASAALPGERDSARVNDAPAVEARAPASSAERQGPSGPGPAAPVSGPVSGPVSAQVSAPILALPALDMPALDRDLDWSPAAPVSAARAVDLTSADPASVDLDLGMPLPVPAPVVSPAPVAITPPEVMPLPDVVELSSAAEALAPPAPPTVDLRIDVPVEVDLDPSSFDAAPGDGILEPRATEGVRLPGQPAGLAPPVGLRAAPSATETVLRDISAWLDATRSQPSRGRRADEPTSAWPPLADDPDRGVDPLEAPEAAPVGRSVPALPGPAMLPPPPTSLGPAVADGATRRDGSSPGSSRAMALLAGVEAGLVPPELRERLARLQGPGELRAAILAFMVDPDSDREVRAWRGETESFARAAQVYADVGQLPAMARLPWFSELVRRAAFGSIEDRRSMVEAARRVMTAAGVVKPLDRLRWLALRHGLGHAQKRAVVTPVVPSTAGELAFFASNRRPIGTYSAFLARLVPLYSSDVGIDPLGARWYDAVMQRFFGVQDIKPAHVPDSDALVHALWALQTMPWMSRPPLIRAWVGEAVSHSGPAGLAREAADALYLTCMMLDSPMPPDLAKAFISSITPATTGASGGRG